MKIKTGVDIIEVQRIKNAMDRWKNRFLEFVFTDKEIAYANKHKYPEQHLAARFAAKEAFFPSRLRAFSRLLNFGPR